MDLFTYLMAKNNQNTHKDLFSYLLGKGSGGGGTYTTFTGTSLNISNTIKAKIKKFMLNSTELTQDGTPTPESPVDVNVITGDNTITISNSDGTEEQNYPIIFSSKNLLNVPSNLNFKATYSIDMELEAGNYTLSWLSVFTDSTNTRANIIMRYEDGTSSGNNFVDFTSTNRSLNPTKKVNRIYFYSSISGPTSAGITITYNNLMLEQGSTATEYEPYYNIEYCKIGDYADQIFKNTADSPYYDNTLLENEWYLKKNTGKIDSYNGETITTTYISTTGGLDIGAIIYYGLTTPTYIHISQANYPILKGQLDNLYNNAKSYNGQTDITQTNEDLPFNISVDVKVS